MQLRLVRFWKTFPTVDNDKELNQMLFLLCLSAIIASVGFAGAIAEATKIGAELLLVIFGLTWFTRGTSSWISSLPPLIIWFWPKPGL